jgi:hypothetical protein
VSALVMGVDPGLTTGVFAVEFDEDGRQAGPHRHADPRLRGRACRPSRRCWPASRTHEHLLAVEQFVVGNRAAKSSSAHAGRVTRALIAELHDLGVPAFLRNASLVKTWATDRRLEAGGLLASTKGMGHARDASRHALYAAVHCGYTTDPLSRQKAVGR